MGSHVLRSRRWSAIGSTYCNSIDIARKCARAPAWWRASPRCAPWVETLYSRQVTQRLACALPLVLLIGCEGRFGFEAHTVRTGVDAGRVTLLDSGRPVDAGRSPDVGVRVDARVPPATDAAMCIPPGDSRGRPVYFGTREDTTLGLTPGQVLAIARVQGAGGGLCSGSVIAPHWVLSAKHCYPSINVGAEVSVGPDPNNPTFTMHVRRAIPNPTIDLLLLELTEDATTFVPGLTPLTVYPGALSSMVGRTVEASGYGEQDNGMLGQRRFTAERCYEVAGDYLSVDGMGARGLCGGDSGGPVMYRESGTVYVLGALTGGDSSCVGQDHYTRVDLGRDWITSNVGMAADPCMGVTAAGRCEGTTATWCEGGAIRRRMCGVCGRSCGMVGTGVDCL